MFHNQATTDTIITGAIGVPLAVLIVWVLNTWALPAGEAVPAEVGAALGAVLSGLIAHLSNRKTLEAGNRAKASSSGDT